MADHRLTHSAVRRWFTWGWVGLVTACSTTRPIPSAPAPKTEEPHLVAALPDAGWVAVQARSMAVSLLLPDAKHWSAAPRDSWWRVAHETTNSVLELKRWRAGGLVRPRDCEAQAVLWRPELRRADEPLVDQRRLVTESELELAVWVHVAQNLDGSTSGHVRGYGASLRECVTVVFTTTASGHNAPALVAQRLQLISDGLVPSITPIHVEQRIERRVRQ